MSIFRLVLANVATLGEIREHYYLSDILDMNEMLDIKSEIEEQASKDTK